MKMMIKNFVKNNYKLILLSILLATVSHSYFLTNQLIEKQYMISPADQFSQMIIFKDLLYDEFSQGNFFYSFFLNGGSSLISRLSYYYSTSLIFYITALFTYILEALNILQSPSMVYWASLTVYISIFRSIIILFVTTKYINMFVKKEEYALLGATFYAFSSIYFRHVALWEFFGDAMIWLPIILYGVESIIRTKDGKIFTIGVSLTLFNNGYFAFANLLFTVIYIVLRFIFKLSQQEESKTVQIKNYLLYGLLGVGLSLPGFIPFVKGFINTSRLSPEFSIPTFEFIDFDLGNLLLNDQIQILPILFIIIVTYIPNYQSKIFRFFNFFSLSLIVLRYNPFVASFFNGLSYPQFRWHYMTFLMIGVAISLGIKKIIEDININLKNSLFLMLSILATSGIYYVADSQLSEHYSEMNIVYGIILSVFIILLLTRIKLINLKYLVFSLLFTGSLYSIFTTNDQLYDDYNLDKVNYEKIYKTFDDPNNPYERALDVIEKDANSFYRIDFTDMRNLGSQKDFSTFNVYNSFQNNYQQYFYRYFQIITNRENNGTIDGLAGRQILSSLFQSDYVIADENNQYIIPTGFELIDRIDNLSIFKNTMPLAFIHPVNYLYSTDEISEFHYKDELLLNGAIVEDKMSNISLFDGPQPHKLSYKIINVFTEIENNTLLKADGYFNVEVNLENENINYEDVVIDYTLKPLDDGEKGRYTYSINNYSIQLKSTGDPYSSQLYRHQAHIPYDEEITFNLAPGTDYIFEIHAIYGVSHEPLINRSQSDQNLDYDVQINKGEINIQFNNKENYPFMVLPLFYEKGWHLEINGENSGILNVNNGMVGFEIPNGEVNIRLTFRQPFLYTTLVISFLSLFILIYIRQRNHEINLTIHKN